MNSYECVKNNYRTNVHTYIRSFEDRKRTINSNLT